MKMNWTYCRYNLNGKCDIQHIKKKLSPTDGVLYKKNLNSHISWPFDKNMLCFSTFIANKIYEIVSATDIIYSDIYYFI